MAAREITMTAAARMGLAEPAETSRLRRLKHVERERERYIYIYSIYIYGNI